ncbi:MAG: adenosine deaminase [Cyanobacteria bacterium RYN_339]|nr:adenosine deaminase [Cyanobacteria bacterium RYN_339]
MKHPYLLAALALSLCWAPAARADETTAARRFQQAQQDEPSLIAFLQRFPKGADLHNHLNGALYSEHLVDWAIAHGMSFDPKAGKFTRDPRPGTVPAAKLLEDDALLAEYRRHASAGTGGHDQFFNAFGYISSVAREMPLADRVALVADEARGQNVHYLELMATIAGSTLRKLAKGAGPVKDLDAALKALKPALAEYAKAGAAEIEQTDRAVATHLGYSGRASDAGSPVAVRYIVQVDRTDDDPAFFATAAAGLALMQAAPGQVVAINIVSPEDHPIARTHFAAQMKMLDFLYQRFGHPNLALHAGELTPACSPLGPLQSHIRQSVVQGHALRIGHGVAVAWDPDAAGLLAELKRRHVAVEICLTSNDAILGVSGARHPVSLYRRAGVPYTIATDDEGVSRSNLTLEYAKLVRTIHPAYTELKDVARNGLEYAFLAGESLYVDHDPRRLRPGFAGVRNAAWQPSPAATRRIQASPKLLQEVRLERDFVAFER